MTPQQFATDGKAWIDAIGAVTHSALASLGLIAVAVGALWAKLVTDRNLRDLHSRLDRHRAELRRLAGEAPADISGPIANMDNAVHNLPPEP